MVLVVFNEQHLSSFFLPELWYVSFSSPFPLYSRNKFGFAQKKGFGVGCMAVVVVVGWAMFMCRCECCEEVGSKFGV